MCFKFRLHILIGKILLPETGSLFTVWIVFFFFWCPFGILLALFSDFRNLAISVQFSYLLTYAVYNYNDKRTEGILLPRSCNVSAFFSNEKRLLTWFIWFITCTYLPSWRWSLSPLFPSQSFCPLVLHFIQETVPPIILKSLQLIFLPFIVFINVPRKSFYLKKWVVQKMDI